jgi:hypothetical protein
MYCAVQGPMPGSRSSAAMVSCTSAEGSSERRPLATSFASATIAAAREGTMPSFAMRAGSHAATVAGFGKSRVRRGSAGLDRVAEILDEAARERRRAFHGDLLAEDRAHGDLEPVHGAGKAQPRIAFGELARPAAISSG